MRIGQGFKNFCFIPGDKIVVGGTLVPWHCGVESDGDGDAVILALADAILGAGSFGGIEQFRQENSLANIDSRSVLRMCYSKCKSRQLILSHADISIMLCQPQALKAYLPYMQKNIVEDLAIDSMQINLKLSTNTKNSDCIDVAAIALLKNV